MADAITKQIEALAQLDALKKEKESMKKLREANMLYNLQAARKEHDANKKQLKNDLKKSSAFPNKIRSQNTEEVKQCIRDCETLNLTLYLSEIVGAIVETSYKVSDVPNIVKMCISLHRRYPNDEFTGPLLSGLRTCLMLHPPEDDKEAGRRKRIQIRFIIELYQTGVCTDDDFLVQLLRSLTGTTGKTKG